MPVLTNPYIVTMPDTGPFVVATTNGTISTSTTTVTFSGYTPVLDDLVIIYSGSNSGASLWGSFATQTEWAALGGTGIHQETGTAAALGYARHFVTAGDVSGGTTTYAVRMFAVSETGEAIGVVIRGVNTSTPVDAFATGDSGAGGSVGTHVLPGLTGTDLADGSLVLSCLLIDSTTAVSGSVPSGWSFIQATTDTNMQGGLYMLDDPTTAGVNVSSQNISSTPNSGYVAATAALTAA